MRIMAANRGRERVVRQVMALKLGYLKRVNIMTERKSIKGGSPHFQRPMSCSFSPNHQSMKKVMDAINPAAAGIGKPVKFRFSLPSPIGCHGIEPGKPERAADKINERNDPADPRKIDQNNPI